MKSIFITPFVLLVLLASNDFESHGYGSVECSPNVKRESSEGVNQGAGAGGAEDAEAGTEVEEAGGEGEAEAGRAGGVGEDGAGVGGAEAGAGVEEVGSVSTQVWKITLITLENLQLEDHIRKHGCRNYFSYTDEIRNQHQKILRRSVFKYSEQGLIEAIFHNPDDSKILMLQNAGFLGDDGRVLEGVKADGKDQPWEATIVEEEVLFKSRYRKRLDELLLKEKGERDLGLKQLYADTPELDSIERASAFKLSNSQIEMLEKAGFFESEPGEIGAGYIAGWCREAGDAGGVAGENGYQFEETGAWGAGEGGAGGDGVGGAGENGEGVGEPGGGAEEDAVGGAEGDGAGGAGEDGRGVREAGFEGAGAGGAGEEAGEVARAAGGAKGEGARQE